MYELKPAKSDQHCYIYKDGEPILFLSSVRFYGEDKTVMLELIELANKSLDTELTQDKW